MCCTHFTSLFPLSLLMFSAVPNPILAYCRPIWVSIKRGALLFHFELRSRTSTFLVVVCSLVSYYYHHDWAFFTFSSLVFACPVVLNRCFQFGHSTGSSPGQPLLGQSTYTFCLVTLTASSEYNGHTGLALQT